jgi:hypothetical protein
MILYLCQGIWHPSMSLDRFKLPASPPGMRGRLSLRRATSTTWQRLSGSTLVRSGSDRSYSRSPRIGRSALGLLAACACAHRIGRPHALSAWLALIIARCVAAHMASRWPGAPMCCWCLDPGAEERRGGAGGKLIRCLGAWGVLVLL